MVLNPCLAEELCQADGKSQHHVGLLNENASSSLCLVVVFCSQENEEDTGCTIQVESGGVSYIGKGSRVCNT